MNMTNDEYRQYSDSHQPRSKCLGNCLKAFLVGGLICCIGEAILSLYIHCGLGKTEASSATSATLVFLGALLTGLGLYDRIARFAGGGTLVPITGFANSMVAPALEFKTEGFISGTAAKMFIISGPVIVYGITVARAMSKTIAASKPPTAYPATGGNKRRQMTTAQLKFSEKIAPGNCT